MARAGFCDRFPNFTACLVRPSPKHPSQNPEQQERLPLHEDYVPRRSYYMYNAVVTDVENFRTLLDQQDAINWKAAGYFQAIPENLLPVLEEVCSKRGSAIGPKQHADFTATGWIVIPAEVSKIPMPASPDGITFRRPDREDMPTLSTLWRYGAGTGETLQYLYHLHDHHFPMIGTYKDGQLIGFGIISADMAMSAGFVKPEFRGQGLASKLMWHSAKDLQNIGQETSFMFIWEENEASKKAMSRGGAQRQEDWKVVYVLYKPHDVDKNDPLMVWYNNIHGNIQDL
ncbi:uncharacterized protein LOC129588616 isoform X2 [Paramacrobiotus metropolitanus]|uniref:uncharacterized protein LOC129588616 isoform X2 n=1 Tax=Paramacrobiotus metropolitanus TaxID=2943436 RepID=UPI0024464155|nr:uncharacterized protein LOC129588616 isoform X2 [Paramacrobiotus metropolitanus]